jgi:hypothetical protein
MHATKFSKVVGGTWSSLPPAIKRMADHFIEILVHI